ncbi:MAG: hypothetical protein JNK15_05790 [Planctomycetes bacterium]|nr:hypothetical protein [Planctomycetota bacterium]
MVRVLGVLFALLFAVFARGQDRPARVDLDGGEVVEGLVVAMDLQSLQIRVGGELRTYPATRIRHFRFVDDVPAGAAQAASDAGPGGAPSAADPAKVGTPPNQEPRITWRGPLPAPADTESPLAVPVDLRERSLWRQRLQDLDEHWPWLSPAAPHQWFSLGLLFLVIASFVVHASVRVAGAEAATFGRSMAIAAWYLVTGVLQIAMVPANDFALVLVLLLNPSMALFWVREFFGLPRLGAVVAFAVQIGFVALGYGALELVDAVLGSIGVTST